MLTFCVIFPTIAVLGGLGILFGIGLAKASKVFFVPTNPKVLKIQDELPGANCGGCGFAGCAAFAKAVAEGKAKPDGCAPGGSAAAKRIAEILGVSVEYKLPIVASVRCRGTDKNDRFIYEGIQDCRAVTHPFFYQAAGPCASACLGFGTCVTVCKFDAMRMSDDGIPVIDIEKCTACGMCVAVCPRKIIALEPKDRPISFSCSNPGKAKDVMSVCGLGCIACGKCVKACKFGALELVNNLIVVNWDKCKGCGLCVKECPTGVLSKTGRRIAKPKKAETPSEATAAPAGETTTSEPAGTTGASA
ncbi:MAG: RnfABCDGE type electron transport complex subunit B [Planctomycetota bacterium]